MRDTHWYLRTVITTVATLSAPALASAQVIPTRVLQVGPQAAIVSAATTRDFLAGFPVDSFPERYGLGTFINHPTPAERQRLEELGIRVLSHDQGTTYLVAVSRAATAELMARESIGLLLLEPWAKVAARIWQHRFDGYSVELPDGTRTNYVANTDGTLTLHVTFYPGVSEDRIRVILQAYAQRFEKLEDTDWIAVITREALPRLAAVNAVQWIDAGPPPFLPDNDSTRIELHVDAVQNFESGPRSSSRVDRRQAQNRAGSIRRPKSGKP